MDALEYARTRLEMSNITSENEQYQEKLEQYLAEFNQRINDDRKHEQRMAELTQNNSFPPTRNSVPCTPFKPQDERIDDFFDRFENFYKRHAIPPGEWVDRLVDLLPPAEFQITQTLPPALQQNYEDVRDALLNAHAITSSKRKEEFKQCVPGTNDNGRMFVYRLQHSLTAWLNASKVPKTYNGLYNHCILDRVLEVLPTHVAAYVRDQGATSPDVVATTIDKYLEARPNTTLHGLCKQAPKPPLQHSKRDTLHRSIPSLSRPTRTQEPAQQGRVSVVRSPSPYAQPNRYSSPYSSNYRQYPVTPNRPSTQPGQQAFALRQPMPRPVHNTHRSPTTGCNYHGPNARHDTQSCRTLGHHSNNTAPPNQTPPARTTISQSSEAHVLTVEEESQLVSNVNNQYEYDDPYVQELHISENDLPPAQCLHAATAPTRGILKTCSGILEGQDVTVLLDSGADCAFVARRLVNPETFTGQTMRTRCASGIIPGCPVAPVNFGCPYFPKSLINAVVLDNPPYDVMLGKIPGTSRFEEPPPTEATLAKEALGVLEEKPEETPTCGVTTRSQTHNIAVHDTTTPNISSADPETTLPSRSELVKAQAECSTLEQPRQKAKKGTEVAHKRGALTTYIYKDDVLHRRTLEGGSAHDQLVVPLKLRPQLLRLAHENPLSGHFHVAKTLARLQKEFSWPQIKSDVERHVRSCHTCQTHAPSRQPKAPLGTVALSTEPFSRVSIDLVGPLSPASSDGHRYVLTMVDQATRYPDAVALRHIDSKTVAEALLTMFSHIGFPRELTSDNGTQFTSQMFEEFLQLLGTEHRLTPPYHAQSNGLVERFNGTLKNMLRKLTTDRPKDWNKHLPALLFAYRDAPHAATGLSPFELIFGHNVRGPLSLVKEYWTSPQVLTEEERETHQYVTSLRERLTETCNLARNRLQMAHNKSKIHFDKRARLRRLKKGDEVLIFLPTSPKKLLMKWKGPYKVLDRLGLYTYSIDIEGQAKTHHINLLRKFHRRDADHSATDIPTMELNSMEETIPSLAWSEDGVDDPTSLSCHVLDTLQEVHVSVAVAMESPDDLVLDDQDPSIPSKAKETFNDCTVSDSLSDTQRQELKVILEQASSQLSDVPSLTSTLQHEIHLIDTNDFKLQHSYPIPYALEETLKSELEKWEDMGIVEKSNSQYCSPLLAVRKKDGSHRFCLDCRQLNIQTKIDQEPIGDPQQIFSQLAESQWFSKLDLAAGYWQVPLSKNARPLTAFRTRHGLYQFCVMPFGLVNAPATFSRLMRRVLEGLPNVYCYLDDVLIATKGWEEHLQCLRLLFEALAKHNLHAKPSKCEFGQTKLTYLGHHLSRGECRPLHDRVLAISQVQPPKNKTQLRSFLGSLGYYQRFIKNYSELTQPLTQFLRKSSPENLQWTDTTIDLFDTLRKILTKEPVLQLPDMSRPFTLQTDASNVGLGAVLLQTNKRDMRLLSPVAYASRLLRPAEKNYSTIEKEGLSVYWALQKFHLYLYGRTFTLKTDHRPLLYLNQADKLNPRLKRWAVYIGLYRFQAEHIPGSENHLPDLLSRTPTM